MPNYSPDPSKLSSNDWRDLSQTLSAPPSREDPLLVRLDYVAELLADAGKLPSKPVLAWREGSGKTRHATVGAQLVVGRHADKADVAFPEDKQLSRTHFVVRMAGEACEVEDLKSHNGTAINAPKNRIRRQVLRDGDLILAGNHIFAFLDQRRTS